MTAQPAELLDLVDLEERYKAVKRDADADPWNFQQDEELIGLVVDDFPALIASAKTTAAERDRLKMVKKRLQRLVQVLLDNEPDDDAADGITVLDVWRKDARAILVEAHKP